MSDKTPEKSGDDDREVERPDEGAESGVDAASAEAEVTRRTSPAPVRKPKKKAAPEADDEVIQELEEGLGELEIPVVERKTANAPVRKGAPTKKRSDSAKPEHDPYGPAGPVTFVKQSAAELQKVVWPTWVQLTTYFVAVLVFVLFMIAFVGVLDVFFGWGLLNLLGDS